MSKEAVRLKVRKLLIRLTKNNRNKKLKCKDFTIISNNCWGGMVYESFNIQKLSPTVGLFFMADEYIKFLKAFPDILREDIRFISPKESKYCHFLEKDSRFGQYPIGYLGDVEICFLHYHNEEEVREKWKRRCERINWNHLIFKMNDQNLCEERHLIEFSSLRHLENKIIFSSKKYDIPGLIYIEEAQKQACVTASQEPIIFSKYFNIITYVNQCFEQKKGVDSEK